MIYANTERFSQKKLKAKFSSLTSLQSTYSCNRQVVEDTAAVFPYIGAAILLLAFIVEAVNSRNLTRLVVSSQQRDLIGPASLQRQKESESFQTVITSIDKISHKHVIGVGEVSASAEELHQIIELTMNISTNGNWAANRLNITLFQEVLDDLLKTFTRQYPKRAEERCKWKKLLTMSHKSFKSFSLKLLHSDKVSTHS